MAEQLSTNSNSIAEVKGQELMTEDVVVSENAQNPQKEEEKRLDRKLVRRLDIKLIPWLCLLYLASFLDRTNIGNAKIEGLQKSLKITSDEKYSATLIIFFVSYALFEPFTNILLKRMRPFVFIPLIMVLWGCCLTSMGLVHNFSGIMAARWWLGFTEAGLYPGVNYYLSCWYKRSELGVRAATFFSFAALSGSFGGLLAAAISKMNGIGGKPGWAWIFIIEGLATIILGIVSYWMIHDFPDEAKFLSDDDRARVIRRLAEDGQASSKHEDFQMKYFWLAIKDWKTWTGMLVYMGTAGPLWAFSLFLPTIVQQLGYTSTRAQLLTVPPYAVACMMTIFIGWVADRTGQRGLCNIGMSIFGIAGFSILLASNNPHVKYGGVFLGALGIYPTIANTITWTSNNIEGVYKRGVTLGCVIGWGSLQGVVSSSVYRTRDAPHFRLGHGVVLGYMVVFLLGGSLLQTFLLRRENSKRKAGMRDVWIEGKSVEEIAEFGDLRPDFIYTI